MSQLTVRPVIYGVSRRGILSSHLITSVMNSRIDSVIKDLTELKSSLQFSQREIDDLKPLTE